MDAGKRAGRVLPEMKNQGEPTVDGSVIVRGPESWFVQNVNVRSPRLTPTSRSPSAAGIRTASLRRAR